MPNSRQSRRLAGGDHLVDQAQRLGNDRVLTLGRVGLLETAQQDLAGQVAQGNGHKIDAQLNPDDAAGLGVQLEKCGRPAPGGGIEADLADEPAIEQLFDKAGHSGPVEAGKRGQAGARQRRPLVEVTQNRG